jgi:diguanylate cyclase (GGDEF)-like protein
MDAMAPPEPGSRIVQRPHGAGRARGRLADMILGPEGPQRFNILVSLTGLCTYLACLLLILYCHHVGLMNPRVVIPICLALVATMVGFYAALRSGWSRRFRDPSLTLAQMLTSITWDAIGYAATREAHSGMLMPVAVTVTYGVFALRGPAVRLIQVYTLLVVGATVAWMSYTTPDIYPPRLDLLVFGNLTAAVMMLTWLAHQLAQLRLRQRQQRDQLTATLAQIEQRATHDALTGLHNRRHMNAVLAHHMARADREGASLTLAMLDIDHFKQINDRHGHAAGDAVLQAFARVAQAMLPGTQVLGRWGGEEFLLVSTENLSGDELRALVDRIRERLLGTPIDVPDGTVRVNFSAGVACYRPGDSLSALLSSADQALYAAKLAGRGRSAMATASSPAPTTPASAAQPPYGEPPLGAPA